MVLGLVLGAAGPRLLARLESQSDRRSRARLTADLPLALDLLAACLTGGAPLLPAVRAVGAAVPGECGERFLRVAAGLAVGAPPAEAWAALAAGLGPFDGGGPAAARALARAGDSGAPVATAVSRAAGDARRVARAAGTEAARRAGVLAVAPLGLCFLPAFVLVGVVPVIAGLAGPLLAGL